MSRHYVTGVQQYRPQAEAPRAVAAAASGSDSNYDPPYLMPGGPSGVKDQPQADYSGILHAMKRQMSMLRHIGSLFEFGGLFLIPANEDAAFLNEGPLNSI